MPFHASVNVFAGELEYDFLVASGCAFVEVDDFLSPALAFGKFGVHAVQVAGQAFVQLTKGSPTACLRLGHQLGDGHNAPSFCDAAPTGFHHNSVAHGGFCCITC